MLDHNLPSPPVTSLRRRIVEIVLATDMAVHKKQVDDMARSVERHTNRQEIDKRMLEQYIVHTADVGHPFRPVPQHQEWARRVNEEFLQQGDREKELGFTPIANPFPNASDKDRRSSADVRPREGNPALVEAHGSTTRYQV